MNKEDIKVIEVDDNENIDVIEVDDNESINNIALNNLLKGEPGKDGEPGTTNYNEQKNKPSINGVELVDNKTSEELGLQPKGDYVVDKNYVHTDNNYTKEEKIKLSSLSNDYNKIENKPRKLYKPPSRRVNIADIEDGAYDIASEFILRLSSSITVSAGSILIKDTESCSIQTLYGGYSFYYDEDANKWYGGYYANSDDVESLILSGTTMSKLSFNSITDLSKVSYGIYINSSNDSSIKLNVLGEERIITGFYINSILIVDFQHNVVALGAKNLIFKYDSTNNYYNEPIDLDELNNRLTNIEDRLTAGGL